MNLKSPVTNADNFRGSLDAPVVLIEYGDFECPYCAEAYSPLESLVEKSGDELCFVFRNFPLTASHPHAELAALGAEAAGQQSQFWEMHHLLYQNFDRLTGSNILAMAKILELDLKRFQHDITEPTLIAKVRNDIATGVRSGVDGTPALFFNGFRYDGPRTYQALKAMVESLINGPEARP